MTTYLPTIHGEPANTLSKSIPLPNSATNRFSPLSSIALNLRPIGFPHTGFIADHTVLTCTDVGDSTFPTSAHSTGAKTSYSSSSHNTLFLGEVELPQQVCHTRVRVLLPALHTATSRRRHALRLEGKTW